MSTSARRADATARSGEARPSITLNRDAADALGRAFKGAHAALRRMRGREQRHPSGLSDAQYALLFCLLGERPMSASELAEAADLSPASVTEMLEGLASAGLVERRRSQRDRRVVLSTLTAKGQALVSERRAQVEPRIRAALAEFSDDQLRTAAAVLDRLRDLFDEFTAERSRD